jgi:hypothetical protein
MISTTPLRVASPIQRDAIALPGICIVETTPPRLAALVGRNLIALAKHYTPPVGVAVTVLSAGGSVSSTIQSVAATFGDLLIMRISDDVGDIVSAAPIASFDEVKRAGTFVITGLKDLRQLIAAPAVPVTIYATGKLVKFRQSESATLQSGDSGAPSFVYVNGEWKYLGSNFGITKTEFFTNVAALYAGNIISL